MKNILVAFLSFLVCSIAYAEPDYNDYQDMSIEQILKDSRIGDGKTVIFEIPKKYTLTLKFSGRIKKNDEKIDSLLREWNFSSSTDSYYKGTYSEALYVDHAGREIFIPIQDYAIEQFYNWLNVGQEFKLFALHIGRQGDNPILLMRAFKAE